MSARQLAVRPGPRSAWRRFAPPAGLALLALAAAALSGCGPGQSKGPPPKTPEVLVSTPVTEEITDYEDFTGRLESPAAVEIRARVTGYLEEVKFEEKVGVNVKKGDVLFLIDPRSYKAELDRAEANLLQAKVRLQRLEYDFQRASDLIARKAIAREEYDKISGDRSEAEAAVKVAEATVTTARVGYGYTKVTAPMSGRIGRRLVDPGNLVKADETILATIVSLDPLYAYFDVDERTVLRLRRLIRSGTVKSAREVEVPVKMELADEEGFPRTGRIDFADNKVDPGTGTLRVRAVFPNPQELLSPGLFVRVRVRIGVPHKALLIAERALGTDQGQKFVYVVNDKGEVAYRAVKVGSLHQGRRVIDSGLAPGEKVIVSGLQRVRQGTKVQPRVVPMPGPGPADTSRTPVITQSAGPGKQPGKK
jgi:RND family efflux transporter MFP subunit